MHPRKLAVNELERRGYTLKRRGGNHDIYFDPLTKSMIPLKRHDFNDNDLRYILKEIDSAQNERGVSS